LIADTHRFRHFPLSALILSASITSPLLSQSEPSVRDSVGIRIVENPSPRPHSGPAIQVDNFPALTLDIRSCATERDPPDVRGAARFASGDVLVADGRHGRICFYAPDGKLRFRFGRFGHGDTSDEFDYITGVFHESANIVAVADARTHRVTAFNPQGRVVSWTRIDEAPVSQTQMGRSRGMIRIQGRFLSGQFLGELRQPSVFSQQGMGTDSMDAVLVQPNGHYAYLTRLLLRSWFFFTGVPVVVGTPSVEDDVPFSPSGSIAVGPRSWYYTDGSAYEIRERSPSNRLLSIIRVKHDVAPVRAADIEHFRASYLKRAVAEQQAAISRALQWVTYPTVMAAYTDLRLDSSGDLWAQRSGFDDEARQWDVFEPDGTYLGTVSVPRDSQVLDIGVNYLLAGTIISQSSPEIRVYRIHRTP
jgi:hypothetical protein